MLVCAPLKDIERERKRGATSIIHFWEGYICTTYEGSYMIYIYIYTRLYIRYLNKKKIFNESTYAYTTHKIKQFYVSHTLRFKSTNRIKRKYARVCAKLYRTSYILLKLSLLLLETIFCLERILSISFAFLPLLSLSFLQRLFDDVILFLTPISSYGAILPAFIFFTMFAPFVAKFS